MQGLLFDAMKGIIEAKAKALGIIEAKVKAFEVGIIFAKEVGIRDLVLELSRGLIDYCTSSKASFKCSINCF